MDDRDLEARLRTHLHRRFDGAQPPPELVASVQQVIETQPRPVGLAATLFRRRPGWAAVVAVGLVAVIAIAGLRFGNLISPGVQPTPTPNASSSVETERWFIALPETDATPTKAETDAAMDVLVTRIQALGVQNVITVTRRGVALKVDAGGPSDDEIRSVLAAVGDVELVPLPPADYGELGEGRYTAVVGEPLPTDPPALFGWEGIASVETPEAGDPADLLITLTAAAGDAFGEYTAAHVGETMAILVDGRVASLPMIQSPIPGGQISISGGSATAGFDRNAAILLGGRLPEAWGAPTSPELVPVEDVIAATQREAPDANPLLWLLDAIEKDGGWIPIWTITFGGQFTPGCTTPPKGEPPCLIHSRLVVRADATNGVPIDYEYQATP